MLHVLLLVLLVKSRTPRNSDTRSSPSGNLFDARSHDDASVSSTSSQDKKGEEEGRTNRKIFISN